MQPTDFIQRQVSFLKECGYVICVSVTLQNAEDSLRCLRICRLVGPDEHDILEIEDCRLSLAVVRLFIEKTRRL